MKNFLDLLATETWIDVEITAVQGASHQRCHLLQLIELQVKDPVSVKIDGFEVLDRGQFTPQGWHLAISEPFYRWRHRVTGQGWLLVPR